MLNHSPKIIQGMATVFTKIIQGEIPCYKVAENEEFFAFLDIRPASKGHTLVVPKVEVDYVFDLNEQTLSGLMLFARTVARAMDRALGTIRTAVIVEGLEVPHAHIHLIPMYADHKNVTLSHPIEVDPEHMEQLARAIHAEWARGE